MIDRDKRDQLAVMLRQLGSGVLSIDEFERLVEDGNLAKTEDRSLLHVLSFASSFYDGDFAPIFLTRFRGKYRLARADRRRIAIAVMFLHSDREFQWPDDYGQSNWQDVLLCWLCAVTACASVIAFAFSLLHMAMAIVGLALVATSFWLFHYAKRYNSLAHERWKSRELMAGRNYNVWPFANDEEFNEALASPWIFNGKKFAG